MGELWTTDSTNQLYLFAQRLLSAIAMRERSGIVVASELRGKVVRCLCITRRNGGWGSPTSPFRKVSKRARTGNRVWFCFASGGGMWIEIGRDKLVRL